MKLGDRWNVEIRVDVTPEGEARSSCLESIWFLPWNKMLVRQASPTPFDRFLRLISRIVKKRYAEQTLAFPATNNHDVRSQNALPY